MENGSLNNKQDYNIENDEKKEQKRDTLLFIIFSLCFLFVSFTATFSFYRFKRVFVPTPVIDIDDNSSESSSSSVRPTPSPQPGKTSSEETNVISHETSSETKPNTSSEEESSEETPTPPSPGTKVLQVVYTDGKEIRPTTTILPGWRSNEKEIKITNKSDIQLKYRLVYKNVTNNFARPQDLVYYIKIDGNLVATSQLPQTDATILNSMTLNAGKTHVVTITIEYKNLNIDQSVDMGKLFAGVVMVENVE